MTDELPAAGMPAAAWWEGLGRLRWWNFCCGVDFTGTPYEWIQRDHERRILETERAKATKRS